MVPRVPDGVDPAADLGLDLAALDRVSTGTLIRHLLLPQHGCAR